MTAKLPSMIHVDGGSFVIGAHGKLEYDAWPNEHPAHEVHLDSFKISTHLITVEEFSEYCRARQIQHPDTNVENPKLPITKVNFQDAKNYCDWLSGLTGRTYDLPTEAQWEYAARGGIQSLDFRFSGSDSVNEVAWYNNNHTSNLHPVGTLKPNELGLFDMSGNVYEWCLDWYDKYQGAAINNPKGPEYSAVKVIRGGSFRCIDKACRISSRYYTYPELQSKGVGIRVVCQSG